MPMESEQELPRPLVDDEIRLGVARMVADHIAAQIVAKMASNPGRMFGSAFPKFRAEVHIKLLLDNFGAETEDNHPVAVQSEEPLLADAVTTEVDASMEIPPMPPNRFRRETDQPIPVLPTKDGVPQTERRVTYAPRRGRKTV